MRDNVGELVTLGKQHFENREYERAAKYLQKVIEMECKYADVYNMMGVMAHDGGRFATAMKYFQEALNLNPTYTEAVLNLAVLYNDLGQYEDAKKLYNDLKQTSKKVSGKIEPVLKGKLSNLHAEIGDIYRSVGLYDHAIEEYTKALTLNPNYFDIRTKLGQAFREDGKLKESVKELAAVVKIKKSYSPALVQLGLTYYSMEKLPDAKKLWKKALEADPQNKYAQMYLKLCDSTSGSSKQSPLTARKSTRQGPSKKTKKSAKRKK
ncbi:MAG: lipoprotein NlpI [bacterium ADurb.Bin270]|nr:tetratricopeptide repeat protein [Myxococcales bacterium]OQA61816.1 MAG: lipoprotein NlpI [bacterium ADurb.Bin270]